MKKIFTTLLISCIGLTSLFSQAVPELLYYKFDGTGTSVPNLASTPPAGTTTATLMGGLTQGPTGQCRGAVIGSGNSSTTDYVNTGWATNLSGTSWTISMWTKDITASATLFYIFGDINAGSFRCFTNGVAGPNNWILRGTGITDVYVNGGATVAPHLTTFVYDITTNNIYAYLDGVLVSTVAQGAPVINGSGPFKVIGYSSNVGAPAGGKLDEFRVYNRALPASEVAMLVNPPATYSTFSIGACSSYTVPSGDETYTVSGTYMDTIPAILECGDSIMTINVSINNNSSTFSTNACGTYTVPSGDETYSVSGTYMDTIPNVRGCDSVMTITVNINPLPGITASAASPDICAGGSDVLTASGGMSYVWSSGGTAPTETVSPSVMTTYTVTGTDMNGCVNTATVMVMVNALPTVNLGSDITQCAGTVTFDAGNAGSTYMWSDATTNQMLTVSASGTYSVVVTDANGCMNSDAVVATINPLPTVMANATSSAVCMGSSVTLTGSGAISYTWDNSVMDGVAFTPASTMSYIVMGTDANGCMNADTIMVAVNALPTVALGADITQCGGTVTLDAQNPGSAYMWNTTDTTQTIIVSSTGIYEVTINDPNGCTGSDTIMVTINTPPTVTGSATSTTVCVDDANVALTGAPAGGTWSGPGVTGSSFNPMTAGTGAQTATYSFTDANGCSGTASVTITVNACVGVQEQSLLNGISIYPNPNNGVFTLAVNANVGDLKIVITDLQGRVVYSSVENNVNAGYTQQINLQNESAGIYMMQISGNGEQRVEKISVQK